MLVVAAQTAAEHDGLELPPPLPLLQAFLREGGIFVSDATVIKQTHVTALADSNCG